ncbi:exocyst complex component 1-like [Xenopus tropicalis]|uniref:Exocyst complex component 1-like n=1 Tax=Xenopus tropicalis TaxID=8364 RepID=A0A8J1JDF8_XENTR|nr:exocyst complex component 1-like [Xenopus tropicalis]
MTRILKINLQKVFFTDREEKLIYVLQLANLSKEKAKNCLCISVTVGNDVYLTWLLVIEEMSEIKCEKLRSWMLHDLTLIDGIDPSADNPVINMHLDSEVLHLEAHSTASKYAFLRCLLKISDEYLGHDIPWQNFDHDFVGRSSSFLVPDDFVVIMKLCLDVLSCACVLNCF